jgi:hypothetical protein
VCSSDLWVNARAELIGVQSAAMSIKQNQQGIAFAAPRPRKYQDSSDLCLCINRHDDLVTELPTNFHHMGKVVTCKSRSSLFRSKHPMKHYRTAVAERQKLGLLAKSWP